MDIVPASKTSKKRENGLDVLITRKAELKKQINNQRQLIVVSSQELLSPSSIVSGLFGTFYKSLNMIDGMIVGFKIFRFVRKLFRRFK